MSADARPGSLFPRLPPYAGDLLVTLVVTGFVCADAASNQPDTRQADAVTWTLVALSVAPLPVRGRWPVPVALVCGAALAAISLYGHIGELLNLPVIVALYTVAVRGDRRRSLWAGAVAAVASGVVSVVAGIDVAQPQGAPVLEMVWPLVPLLLGEVVRTHRELLREYAERSARAEREREREAERRVREERVRIARELHDVVAHTVSAMTVQAGLALDALDSRPELARQAMRQVRASGKEAVRELRTTVGVLREPGSVSRTAEPAPRLGRLRELTQGAAAAGIRVALRVDTDSGEPPELPGSLELAAYRIVQEALTNVVKHANARHAAVWVRRERTPEDGDRLVVEITDDGRGGDGAETGEGGHGIVGMRERAAAAGGSIACGPAPGGGWRVRAALPVDGGGP